MATPFSPCDLLQQALQQYYALSSGSAVVAVETPQLGRVEYSAAKGNLGDLQRLIDGLAAACLACGGTLPPGLQLGRRKPFSFEAWP
jgi:hypothetical protein